MFFVTKMWLLDFLFSFCGWQPTPWRRRAQNWLLLPAWQECEFLHIIPLLLRLKVRGHSDILIHVRKLLTWTRVCERKPSNHLVQACCLYRASLKILCFWLNASTPFPFKRELKQGSCFSNSTVSQFETLIILPFWGNPTENLGDKLSVLLYSLLFRASELRQTDNCGNWPVHPDSHLFSSLLSADWKSSVLKVSS